MIKKHWPHSIFPLYSWGHWNAEWLEANTGEIFNRKWLFSVKWSGWTGWVITGALWPKEKGSRSLEKSALRCGTGSQQTTTGPAERRKREVLLEVPSPHAFIQQRCVKYLLWQSAGKGRAIENSGASHLARCKGSMCLVFGSIASPCWEIRNTGRTPNPHKPSQSELPGEEFRVCVCIFVAVK